MEAIGEGLGAPEDTGKEESKTPHLMVENAIKEPPTGLMMEVEQKPQALTSLPVKPAETTPATSSGTVRRTVARTNARVSKSSTSSSTTEGNVDSS